MILFFFSFDEMHSFWSYANCFINSYLFQTFSKQYKERPCQSISTYTKCIYVWKTGIVLCADTHFVLFSVASKSKNINSCFLPTLTHKPREVKNGHINVTVWITHIQAGKREQFPVCWSQWSATITMSIRFRDFYQMLTRNAFPAFPMINSFASERVR